MGSQTTFTYSGIGGSLNAAIVTDPNGNSDVYAYDSGRRLTLTEDAEGYAAQGIYDADNNITQITDPRGKVWLFPDYDLNGNCRTAIDPNHNTTRYAYDSRSNLLSVTDALHQNYNAYNHTVQYAYDTHNNLFSITDGNNHATTCLYDNSNGAAGYGLLLKVTDALGNATTYSNYVNDDAQTVTDANGHAKTYTFDALGQNPHRDDAAWKRLCLYLRRMGAA